MTPALALLGGLAWAGTTVKLGEGVEVEDGGSGARVVGRLMLQEELDVVPAAQVETLGLPVLRPDFRLDPGDSIPVTARVQTELAGASAALLDAHLDWGNKAGFGVCAGRVLVPSSRHQLTPVPKLALQDFAPTSDLFRRGRDLGVQGSFIQEDGPMDVRLGLFDNAPMPDGSSDPVAIGRVAVSLGAGVPLDEAAALEADGFGLVLGATGQQTLQSEDAGTVGAELAWRVGPVVFSSEGHTGQDGRLGAYGQLSVGVVPEKVMLMGRFDRNRDAADLASSGDEEGVIWMIEPRHALRASLAHRGTYPDGADPVHEALLRAQLYL